MIWPDGERYLRPLQSLVLSLLFSHIHSSLFSDWRRTVSKFFDTQVPSVSTKELVLPCHARCILSRLRCNGHSLLLTSYLSRIGRIEKPCCSVCGHSSQDTSHFILHCPATDSLRRSFFGDSLSLYHLWPRISQRFESKNSKFYFVHPYLGGRLNASGGSEAVVTARTAIRWIKFRECG